MPDPDPPPVEPTPPHADDCCRSGCDPCVFDLHDDAISRYRNALRAWRQRNPGRKVESAP
ncbi:MAG: oxidoreductase-like domain-containing protein [Casimicrobiaceae bacterium]